MKNLLRISLSIILAATIFSSCKKEDETNNTSEVSSSAYYFSATIGGKEISYQSAKSGYISTTGYQSSSEGGDVWVGQNLTLTTGDPAGTGGATIVKHFGYTEETCDGYKSMFKEKTYSHGSLNHEIEGALIFYYDESGKYWASDNGPANNSDFSFTITSHKEVSGYGTQGVTTCTFSCTLFDDDGNSITLSNGKMKSVSVQCF